MGDIGAPELLLVLAIAMVMFGGKRLPELASSLGKSIRSFRQAASDDEAEEETPPAA